MIAYCDGATAGTNDGDAPIGAGVVIVAESGEVIDTLCVPCGRGTNNEAEYIAVIEALEWALRGWLDGMTVESLRIRSDSQLIVNQIKGIYGVHDEKLKVLHTRVDHLRKLAKKKAHIRVSFKWIPRETNEQADKISKEAAWLASQTVAGVDRGAIVWRSRNSSDDTP